MSSSQKALWVLFLLFLPFLRVSIAGSPDLQYFLWLDEGTYAIQTKLESSNAGLTGADLYQVQVSPSNPDLVVASGYSLGYISRDKGNSWQVMSLPGGTLTNERPFYFSPDGTMYVCWGSNLLISSDGKTWKEHYDSTNYAYGMLPDGTLWARRGLDKFFEIELQGGHFVVGDQLPEEPEFTGYPRRDERIVLEDAQIEATLTTQPDGSQWAATARGSYFRPSAASEWEERTTGQNSPNALYFRQSPVQPEEVLMLDSGRRLWKSSDFGATWSREGQGAIQSARYDSSGRLVLVHADGTVTDGDKEIDVPRALRIEALGLIYDKSSIERYLSEQAFLDAGRAPTGELWILSSRLGHHDRQNYNNPFRGVAGEWYLMESDRLLVLKDGEWSVRPSFELSQLEPTPEEPELAPLSDGPEIAFNGEEILYDISFLGLPERAGWLTPGERYFLIGEQGIQIGQVSGDRPVVPAVIWSWSYATHDDTDRAFLRPEESELLRSTRTVRVLIPGSTGVWLTEVPVHAGWHWRLLAYQMTYGPHLWVLWGVIVIAFLVQWRRASRF